MNRLYGLLAVLALLASSPAGYAQYSAEGKATTSSASPSLAAPISAQPEGRYLLPPRTSSTAPASTPQVLFAPNARGGQSLDFLFTSGPALPGAFAEVGRRCGTPDVTPEQAAAVEQALQSAGTAERSGIVTIPVVFHVVRSSAGQGDITQTQIDDQIDVLNHGFAGMGVQFAFQAVNRVTNDAWFGHASGSADEVQMKTALAVDPAHVLNIYTGLPTGGSGTLLGYATFPFMYPEASPLHGVVLNYQTLPGGSASGVNLGVTATHEVGHYLGLYHTFQGGCDGRGDYVSDTPSVAAPNFGCLSPGSVDSCPGDGQGADMVDNFMDYGDDACLDQFTSLQTSRVDQMLPIFKPSLGGGVSVTAVAEQEANNSLAAAQPLTGPFPLRVLASAESSDTGEFTIDYGNGLIDDVEDVYTITTTEAGLVVGLGDFSRDLDLFLLNASGQLVGASSEGGDIRGEGFVDPDLPAGTYFLAVSFFDADGTSGSTSYSLTVRPGAFSSVTAVGEQESNNAAATAQVLAGPFPVLVAGSAEANDVGALRIDYGDGTVDDFEDLYAVTTTAPGLTISLAGFDRDLDLFLLSASGDVLAQSNEGGETTSEAIADVSLAAGTYLIAVSFWDGDGTTGSSAYALRVNAATSTANNVAETEPNGEPASAQPLGGPSPVTVTATAESADVGSLFVDYGSGATDDFEDLYVVTTTAPGLSITLDGFNRDLDLFLIDATAGGLVGVSNETSELTPETISEPSLPAGTYLVGVSFYDAVGTGITGTTNYRLRIEGSLGTVTDTDDGAEVPTAYALSAAYPNPTAGRASFALSVEQAQAVRVEVLDVLGRRVALLHDGPLATGAEHTFVFDGSALAAGTYFYRASGEHFAETGRLTVAK